MPQTHTSLLSSSACLSSWLSLRRSLWLSLRLSLRRLSVFFSLGFSLSLGLGLSPSTALASPPSPRPASRPSIVAEAPSLQPDPTFLTRYAKTFRFRLGRPSSFRWSPDSRRLYFLRSPGQSFVKDLYAFDLATNKEELLLTASSILKGAEETLSAEEKARRERLRMASRGIASFQLSKDGRSLLVPLAGKLYIVDVKTKKVREYASSAGYPIAPTFSPDGRFLSVIRSGDVYVIDVASGIETRLTHKTSPTQTYGTAEFVAQEEMGRMEGLWWSPDSRWIVFQETEEKDVERLYLHDQADPSKPPQSFFYPRAGKKNAIVRLHLLHLPTKKQRPLVWDHAAFPYLAKVVWSKHGPLTLLVQDRLQKKTVLLTASTEGGQTAHLATLQDPAWLNLDPSLPLWLPKNKGFLLSSEESGFWQIYRFTPDGKARTPVTPPRLSYRKVVHLGGEGRFLFFAAGHLRVSPHPSGFQMDNKGRVRPSSSSVTVDPTQTHVYRLDLHALRPSSEVRGPQPPLSRRDIQPHLLPLSSDRGEHSAWIAPDGQTYLLQSFPFQGKPTFSIRTIQGKLLGHLRDPSEKPGFPIRLELLQTRASLGKEALNFHTSVIRPRSFREDRRYPVLLYIYGGPGVRMVSTDRSRYAFAQWVADHGFLVVSLDGRGTPGRGRAWERATYKEFVVAPLRDQIAGLQALCRFVPQADCKRVGIYGWSFGGTMAAMATIAFSEVFSAGVAGAPVTDWMDYDTHYTERYLSLPQDNPLGYKAGSAISVAPSLRKPLLLVHGTADDNVYFSHTLKLSDALLRAGRPHDVLPLSGHTHMVAEPLVVEKMYSRILAFLTAHLGGPEKSKAPRP